MFMRVMIILISAITIVIFNTASVMAMEETEATSEKYLIDHGHSLEVIRLINLQKKRAGGNTELEIKQNSPIKKFFKNLWFEQDATMPVSDFGQRKVKTAETDEFYFEKDTNAAIIKNNCEENNIEQKTPDNEVEINDVKVRDAE